MGENIINMKKDIHVPKVENLFLAITLEYNSIFKTDDYYVYLINEKNVDLEMVLIVSKGFDQRKETSQMRHKIEKLPANSFAKIEWIQEDVLKLNNEFKVTFFENNKMFEKNFIVKKGDVKRDSLKGIEMLNKRGFIIK